MISVDDCLCLLHFFIKEEYLINVIFCLLISLTSQVSSVDQAIELYLMGDMNGSITALEALLAGGDLSLDEEIRAYHRLGAAYFGVGEPSRTESAFYSLLQLDPYYDLGPWENPQLGRLLNNVRQTSMATILVQGEPEGALVFMNGEYLGSTPYIKDNLISGRTYNFTIMAEGFESAVQSCTALPGQLHTMTYQMDPIASSTDIFFLDRAIAEAAEPSLPDLSQENTSSDMTINQLNALLIGGEQMTTLESFGPLLTDSDELDGSTSSQEIIRNPTRFLNAESTIDISSENQARMVFSDVNMDTTIVLQTDPGSAYSSRTSNEVRQVLTSKESAVTFIYNKHLRSDPLLSGTVLIEMIIEPSGRISNVAILDSSTFNPAFDLELASAVETWRFGAVDANEGPLPVTYPFNFSR